eukprot:8723285-Prorocentrum_lima.AAC.1
MMLRPGFPNDTVHIVPESTFRFYSISDYPALYIPAAEGSETSDRQRPVGSTDTCILHMDEPT